MSEEYASHFDLLHRGNNQKTTDFITSLSGEKCSDDLDLLKIYHSFHNQQLESIKDILSIHQSEDKVEFSIWELYLAVASNDKVSAASFYDKIKYILSNKIKHKHLSYLYLLTQANYFLLLEEYDEAETLYLQLINKIDHNNFYIINAVLYRNYAKLKEDHEDYKLAMNHHIKSLEYFALLDDKLNMSVQRRNLGMALMKLGDYEDAINHLKTAIQLARIVGNKKEYYLATFHMGLALKNRGEFIESASLLSSTLDYHRSKGDLSIEARILLNLGIINGFRGYFDLALVLFEESKNLAIKISDNRTLANSYNHMGMTFHRLGRLEVAYSYFVQSYEIKSKIPMRYARIKVLFNLYWVASDMNNVNIVEKYYNLLQQYPETSGAKLARGMELSKSKRIRNLVMAQDIFNSLANSYETHHEIRIQALLKLAGILINEFRDSKEPEIIDETLSVVSRLEITAKKQNSYWLMAQTMLLRSNLELLQLNIKSAKQLINNAEELALKNGLIILANSISNEHDKILNDLEIIETAIDNNAEFISELGMDGFSDLVGQMINKRIDTTYYEEEESILLLIISPAGTTIYSRYFSDLIVRNEQLIGGFMKSITKMLGEILSETGYVERIKIQEFTLLYKTVDNIAFLYIVRGTTFNAKQRLEKLIGELIGKEMEWEVYRKKIKLGRIDGEFNLQVDKIVDELLLDQGV